jgi:hypothetical protein
MSYNAPVSSDAVRASPLQSRWLRPSCPREPMDYRRDDSDCCIDKPNYAHRHRCDTCEPITLSENSRTYWPTIDPPQHRPRVRTGFSGLSPPSVGVSANEISRDSHDNTERAKAQRRPQRIQQLYHLRRIRSAMPALLATLRVTDAGRGQERAITQVNPEQAPSLFRRA